MTQKPRGENLPGPEVCAPDLALRVGVGRFSPVVALLIALAFLSVRISQGIYLGDEGVTCMGGWQASQGAVPCADTFEILPPLSFYPPAAVFRLLGPSVLSSRLLGLIYGIALVALAWALARKYLSHPLPQALVLSFLVPFGVGAWPIPSHHWAVDLCQLASLWALGWGLDHPGRGWVFLGGLTAGCGILCLQDQGGYFVLAVSLFFLPFTGKGRRLNFALEWLGGLLTASVSAAALLLPRASMSDLWYGWVIFPATRYSGLQNGAMASGGGWGTVFSDLTLARWSAAPLYIALTLAVYGLLFLLPWAALSAGAAALAKRWLPRQHLALLLAAALAFTGGAAHRWSIMNLVWASPALALLLAVVLDRLWDRPERRLRWPVRWGTAICVALLLGFGCVGIARQGFAKTYTVEAPAGISHTFDPSEARALQEFVDAIGLRVPAGAPAFSWGYIPMVNFLTGHPNSTRFSIFITSPPYNTPEQVRDWIETLEKQKVEWGFSCALPLRPEDEAASFLSAKYIPVWSNGAYILWGRRKP